MLAWLIPSVFAGGALFWAIFQHYNPRKLCRLHYMLTSISEDKVPMPLTIADAAGIYDGTGRVNQRYIDLIGKVVEIRSTGNTAAEGILVHMRMKCPIYNVRIETDETFNKPEPAGNEINFKLETLNPEDKLRVIILCDKQHANDDTDILEEHRVTMKEGIARLTRKW